MAAQKFLNAISRRGRASQNGFGMKKTLNIFGEFVHGGVTAAAIFLEALHDDPVEFAAQGAFEAAMVQTPLRCGGGEFWGGKTRDARGRTIRFDFANGPAKFVHTRLQERLCGEGSLAGKNFVEKNAQ